MKKILYIFAILLASITAKGQGFLNTGNALQQRIINLDTTRRFSQGPGFFYVPSTWQVKQMITAATPTLQQVTMAGNVTTNSATFGENLILDRYKNGNSNLASNYFARTFGGTSTTPTAILNGEIIGSFGASAFNGINADGAIGSIRFYANGNQTNSNRGSTIDLSVTPLNGTLLNKSILNANSERVLLSDASNGNAAPVAIGYYGKTEIPGENPHKFQVVSDGLNPTVSMGNFGGINAGNSGGHLWASRGTANSPTALLSGDFMWSWGYRGQGATILSPSSAAMGIVATENFSDSAHGTKIFFQTNANGNNANFGRTSTFTLDQDGFFRSEKNEVQSYSSGKLGQYRLNYTSINGGSRSWIIANDYDNFGDFAILTSQTHTGSTNLKRLSIEPNGDVQIYNNSGSANAVVRNTDLSLYALDANVVHKTGTETVAGIKTFSNNMIVNGAISTTGSISAVGDVSSTTANFNLLTVTNDAIFNGITTVATAPVNPTDVVRKLDLDAKLSTPSRFITAVSYTISLSDVGFGWVVGVTNTLAPRTITLPLANTVPSGWQITIKDESGGAGTNPITNTRSGSDLIDGATSIPINTNYGSKTFYTDGISKWFII